MQLHAARVLVVRCCCNNDVGLALSYLRCLSCSRRCLLARRPDRLSRHEGRRPAATAATSARFKVRFYARLVRFPDRVRSSEHSGIGSEALRCPTTPDRAAAAARRKPNSRTLLESFSHFAAARASTIGISPYWSRRVA